MATDFLLKSYLETYYGHDFWTSSLETRAVGLRQDFGTCFSKLSCLVMLGQAINFLVPVTECPAQTPEQKE